MIQIIALIIGFGVALLFNALIVWVGMLITRITSSPTGLALIALALTLPYMFLPFIIAAPLATITFFLIVPKFSSAEGFLDTLLLVVVMNVMSIGIGISLYQAFKNNPEVAKLASAYHLNSQPSQESQESDDEVIFDADQEPDPFAEPDFHAAAAPGSNAMDVYGKDLTPQEIAEIERISGAPVKR